MEIFLDRLVTVADGPVRDQVDVIGVSEAIMAEIVTNCCHADGEGIQLAHSSELNDVALRHEQVAHLEDVHGVHVVVILDVAPVALEDLTDETR